MRGRLLLELVDELEQEAGAGVVRHLQLRELRAGNRARDTREMHQQFHRLGDQALAAAAIAGPVRRGLAPLIAAGSDGALR